MPQNKSRISASNPKTIEELRRIKQMRGQPEEEEFDLNDPEVISALKKMKGWNTLDIESFEELGPPKQPTGLQNLASQAIRIVPAVAGGIVGGVVGGPPGAVIGSGLGSGAGEWAGQAVDIGVGTRKEYNIPQIATQTALGTIPPIWGKAPGMAAGSAAWKEYAKRAVPINAAEGALLGGAATFPTAYAETGELPGMEQIIGGATMGGALGGATGYAMGRRPAMARARGLEAIEAMEAARTPPAPPAPPPARPPLVMHGPEEAPPGIGPSGQAEFPFMRSEQFEQRPPPPPPEPPMRQPNILDFPIEQQLPLRFGQRRGGPGNRFLSEAAPEIEPSGQFRMPFSQTEWFEGGRPAVQRGEFQPLGEGNRLPGMEAFENVPALPSDTTPAGTRMDPAVREKTVAAVKGYANLKLRNRLAKTNNPEVQEIIRAEMRTRGMDMEEGVPETPEVDQITRRLQEIAGEVPERIEENLPDIVAKNSWTQAELAFYLERGYQRGGAMPDGSGRTYLYKPGAELPTKDTILPGDTKPAAPPPPRTVGPVAFDENGELRIANPSKSAINRLKRQGIVVFRDMDEKGYTVFKRESDMPPVEGAVEQPPATLESLQARAEQLWNEADKLDAVIGRGGTKGEAAKARQKELMDELREVSDAINDTVPQEMRVPGWREGTVAGGHGKGLENVAMGGATPRVLDVIGSSLYSRDRPVVATKELLQNAFDEHAKHGISEPVRVFIDNGAKHPVTKEAGTNITVRDRGKGLTPEEIYTVLTNLGETGKAGEESASGGFGFAKASPFLGGKWARVVSTIEVRGGAKMRYSFEGTPTELKNQARGVAVNESRVSQTMPTGLEITVFYNDDTPGLYKARDWAINMTERSSKNPEGILIARGHGTDVRNMREWLEETILDPAGEFNIGKHTEEEYKPKPQPTLVETIGAPGANVDIRYDIEPGLETSEARVHLLNKGMYQGSTDVSYGESTTNVPRSIVTDINATVEEGHDLYPFSANREQISDDVNRAIRRWINDNIVTGVTKKRVAAVQKKYDSISLLHETGPTDVHYYDDGGRFTPEEIKFIAEHPKFTSALNALEIAHLRILEVTDSLGWTPESYGAKWRKPSERLKKFGVLFQAPEANGSVTLGIHVPRPDDLENSAILINLPEILNKAMLTSNPIDQLTTDIFTVIAHEQAHIPGGTHDKDFAYRDAELRAKLGEMNTVSLLEDLGKEFGDGRGGISPELSEVLSVYNESRGRAESSPDALLATGIASKRRQDTARGTAKGAGGIGGGKGQPPIVGGGGGRGGKKPPSIGQEIWNLPRGATTILDLSAALRQGLPLVFTKEWRKAWEPMLAAYGNEGAFNKQLQDIKNRPLFKTTWDADGREIVPWAKRAGIKIMEATEDLSTREESTASNWVETGGFLGKDNPAQRAYAATLGKGARASNRAYMAFLNQLRADTFERLMKDAKGIFDADVASGGKGGALDPYKNLVFAKQIADYVNTASGRGPLRLARPTFYRGEEGKWKAGLKETTSFEQASKILTGALFSPRLFFAHARMLNPLTYMMAPPFVRKQYLKSALNVAGAWGSAIALAKIAGADVSTDPNSADFGKIRVGDTRLDPAGGFQQYLVALSRLVSGRTTSSGTGREFELGQGYRAETRQDVAERFITNKFHPLMKFGWDIASASKYQPFHTGDRTLQLFVPLIAQDAWEIMREDPTLLPLLGPVAAGMGTQTYGKGESVSKIVPRSVDWAFKGGSPWPF